MDPENHVLEKRKGGTEKHEAEHAEATKQNSAQAEPIAPTGSANDSECGVENEILDNIGGEEDDRHEHVDETLSNSEAAAEKHEQSHQKKSKSKKRGKKTPKAPLGDMFDFRYLTYLHLAEWTTRESKGVMDVLRTEISTTRCLLA